MKSGWRGIYSLHTESNRYTQFAKLGGTKWKLGRTDSANLVTVRIFGGTEMQLNRADLVRVMAYHNLGVTDYTNSVRPIHSFGETKKLRRGNREFTL